MYAALAYLNILPGNKGQIYNLYLFILNYKANWVVVVTSHLLHIREVAMLFLTSCQESYNLYLCECKLL